VTVGAATPGDLERVLMVDAESFGSDVETTRPWMTPLLHDSRVTVVIASDVRGPIGTGYAVRSDGHAGHAVYIGGVGVLEHARRCGVGSTISSWLLQRSYAQGAEMASLQPDTDEAALVYARLGFIGAVDYHVYVDVSPERDDGTSFREPHEP
jgi:GNAT superfamily N-acetyltransferase